MSAIETRALTKRYGGPRFFGAAPSVVALDALDLEVRRGEIFGFLGPNGAGKSTTIRLLLGFLHPTHGHGRVFDLDCERDSVEIRRRVGYLPGGIAFYDAMTGEGILDLYARLSGRAPVRRGDLCAKLELTPKTLRRKVRDYSRGMRQKIGIVQALQHDPELAVLDEPTEGLDPLMQRAFYDILADVKAAGRTVFFSSHVLPEVERVCDRVAIIRGGRLVALEDVATLLKRRRRQIALRFEGTPPDLTALPGVSGVAIEDGRLTCRLEGDVRPLLAALSRVAVVDLTIEPARLEEAFVEFYENGAAQ